MQMPSPGASPRELESCCLSRVGPEIETGPLLGSVGSCSRSPAAGGSWGAAEGPQLQTHTGLRSDRLCPMPAPPLRSLPSLLASRNMAGGLGGPGLFSFLSCLWGCEARARALCSVPTPAPLQGRDAAHMSSQLSLQGRLPTEHVSPAPHSRPPVRGADPSGRASPPDLGWALCRVCWPLSPVAIATRSQDGQALGQGLRDTGHGHPLREEPEGLVGRPQWSRRSGAAGSPAGGTLQPPRVPSHAAPSPLARRRGRPAQDTVCGRNRAVSAQGAGCRIGTQAPIVFPGAPAATPTSRCSGPTPKPSSPAPQGPLASLWPFPHPRRPSTPPQPPLLRPVRPAPSLALSPAGPGPQPPPNACTAHRPLYPSTCAPRLPFDRTALQVSP